MTSLDQKTNPQRIPYSEADSSLFVDVYSPAERVSTEQSSIKQSSNDVVILYHGGFFKEEYPADFPKNLNPNSESYMSTLARDLANRGYTAVVAEYLRVPTKPVEGESQGEELITGPTAEQMLQSVYDSFDRVKENFPDAKITVIGHSAGGYYVTSLAMRHEMSAALGLTDGPLPDAVVAMAPVLDLDRGQEVRLSDSGDAIERFVYCGREATDRDPARYGKLAPSTYPLPPEISFAIVHGELDTDVPVEGQSDRFAETHSGVKLTILEEQNHYAFLDPTNPAWQEVVNAIPQESPTENSELQKKLR